jgi:ribonuclease HIII
MNVVPKKPLTSYSCSLQPEQLVLLKKHLREKEFEFKDLPHAYFGASRENVNLVVYRSGKLLIQGKGTRDFVEFVLEPQILKEIRLGYEDVLDEFKGERIGVDESGKGDYFGPLVIAGVYVNREKEKKLKELKVRDSKKVSDRRVKELRKIIREDFVYSVVAIGPERYNQLYATMENMNRILAWGHARVIENILSKVNCEKAVLDRFGRKDLVLGSLMKKGRSIEVDQQFRGEADPAVAAASVLARAEFLIRLKKLSDEFGVVLPKGNNKRLVIKTARAVVEKCGLESLVRVGKVHFKTTKEILSTA